MSRPGRVRAGLAVMLVKLDDLQHAYDLTDEEMRLGFHRWQCWRDIIDTQAEQTTDENRHA